MVAKFKENELFKKWMKVPEKWSIVIGGHLLWEIERRCRKLLRLRMMYGFQLENCPQKVEELVLAGARSAAAASPLSEEAHVQYQKMNNQAREYVSPWLHHLNMRNASSTLGIPNRTRVAELLAAVKISRNYTRPAGTTNRNRTMHTLGISTRNRTSNQSDRHRKSLDAFQARLAELKQARAERLANTTRPEPSLNQKNGPGPEAAVAFR